MSLLASPTEDIKDGVLQILPQPIELKFTKSSPKVSLDFKQKIICHKTLGKQPDSFYGCHIPQILATPQQHIKHCGSSGGAAVSAVATAADGMDSVLY
jgi:hypothetical protein